MRSSKLLSSLVAVGVAGVMGVVGGGVAEAAPRIEHVPDAAASITTGDGWVLHVEKTGEQVTVVSPLDNSPFSREAFWDMRAATRLTGAGSSPVIGGEFEFGVQVGCQADLSGGGTVGSSVGPTAQVTVSGVPGVSVGVAGQLSVSANVKPGSITTVPIKKFGLSQGRAAGAVGGIHVAVSGCWGKVTVRSYAQVSTATSVSQDSIAAYGRPVEL